MFGAATILAAALALAAAAQGGAADEEGAVPEELSASQPGPGSESSAFQAGTESEGGELIGRAAPSWDADEWIQGGPLSLEKLRGQVVLMRWWTGPECPFCGAAATHLNRWDAAYRDRGLTIIGFYHHKSAQPLTHRHVARLVERFDFRFPVAIDSDWRMLRRWWLDGHDRRFTSVTFLMDREGIIRQVHPGGAYTMQQAQEIDSLIRQLLG